MGAARLGLVAMAIDPKIKAKAIADLLSGEQPAVVAARYRVPAGTVRQWKARLVTPDVTQSVTPPVTPPPGRAVFVRKPQREAVQLEIGALVVANLRAKLLATQRIVEHVANNPQWIQEQNAAVLGELFERIDRSSIAMLDRMAAAGRPATADGNTDPD